MVNLLKVGGRYLMVRLVRVGLKFGSVCGGFDGPGCRARLLSGKP